MQYLAEKHAAPATHIHDRGQTLEWKSREYRFGRQARERSHTGIHDRLQFRVLRIIRKWILLPKMRLKAVPPVRTASVRPLQLWRKWSPANSSTASRMESGESERSGQPRCVSAKRSGSISETMSNAASTRSSR